MVRYPKFPGKATAEADSRSYQVSVRNIERYNPRVEEPRWQKAWDEARSFVVREDDTREVLTEAGISNKVITSDVKQLPQQSHYASFIALVETLNNRLQENDQFLEDIGLVIVDEAHNNSFRKIFHYFNDVNILGVTATPLSSNKKLPLYQTGCERDLSEAQDFLS